MPVVKKAPFVVSFVADLRPLVAGLNRELLSRGAEPVCWEELSEVDLLLHEGPPDRVTLATRCPRCRGYLLIDASGEHTCLNCARPTDARRLEEVIQQIVQQLVERRRERSSVHGSAL
jgi:hypothetical protein